MKTSLFLSFPTNKRTSVMVLIQAELTQRGSVLDSLSREVYAKRIHHLGLSLSLRQPENASLVSGWVAGGFTPPKR